MEILNYEQNSPEWFEARLGMVTASNFSKVLAGGQGKTRRSYMLQLAAERLTKERTEGYTNAAMEWGNETEPQARAAYELFQEVNVELIGFCKTDDWVGCSPDAFVGDEGLLEIKCPTTTTQISRFIDDVFPISYKAQVQGQLLGTGRQWCDFVSFDPRIAGKAQYFCKRVERDEDYINHTLWPGINRFVEELEQLLGQLK